MKKINHKAIIVLLPIYSRSIIVVFEWNFSQILSLAKSHQIKVDKFSQQMKDAFYGQGLCCQFGDDNVDILIWCKVFPDRASNYGVLYHEIYHAVDAIAHQIDPTCGLYAQDGLSEARAYLYEYIVTCCNKVLWAKETKKNKKK